MLGLTLLIGSLLSTGMNGICIQNADACVRLFDTIRLKKATMEKALYACLVRFEIAASVKGPVTLPDYQA